MILCKRSFKADTQLVTANGIKEDTLTVEETLVTFDNRMKHYVVEDNITYEITNQSCSNKDFDSIPVYLRHSKSILDAIERFKEDTGYTYVNVHVLSRTKNVKEIVDAEEYKLALFYANYFVFDGDPSYVLQATRAKWTQPDTYTRDECKYGWEFIAEMNGWERPLNESSSDEVDE